MDIADYPVGLQERPLFYGLRAVEGDCVAATNNGGQRDTQPA